MQEVAVALLLLSSAIFKCKGESTPGKPILINCRSPEKETFTCWWEPGSDGGLPTTHHLYYRKENSDKQFECPDYLSAGPNSCFFDKSHTSIWVNYNLTVVASNTQGNTCSDPLEVDVMHIVQPSPPENVTVTMVKSEDSPYLLIQWEPPPLVDTRSGWITLTYELNVTRKNNKEWEEYRTVKQTQFNIYNPHPGDTYIGQVRCKLDQGYWSEWSHANSGLVPDYNNESRSDFRDLQDQSTWTVVLLFLMSVFLVTIIVLIMKRKYLKHLLLPPIPGPKIIGLDSKLLKIGRPQDMLSSLIFDNDFPTTVACKDQIEEYLLVFDSEGALIPHSPSTPKSMNTSMEIISNGFLGYSEGRNKILNIDQGHKDFTFEKDGSENILESRTPVLKNTLPTVEQLEFFAQRHAVQSYTFNNQKDLCQNTARKHDDYGETVQIIFNCDNKSIVDDTGIVSVPSGTGYVDIEQPMKQPEGLNEGQVDYSKVSGVDSDNMLLLQKEAAVLTNNIYNKKGDHAHSTNQWPSKPHPTGSTKEGAHIEFTGNGYVESFPLM